MIEIFAVRPPRGAVVHLHSPGYKPSAKDRGSGRSALCGAPVWPNSQPDVTFEMTLSPLAEAVRWTSMRPVDTDPRPAWRWCRACVGHAIEAAGLVDEFLVAVADRHAARGAP